MKISLERCISVWGGKLLVRVKNKTEGRLFYVVAAAGVKNATCNQQPGQLGHVLQ